MVKYVYNRQSLIARPSDLVDNALRLSFQSFVDYYSENDYFRPDYNADENVSIFM